MSRQALLQAVLVLACLVHAPAASAMQGDTGEKTLVLPLRTIGASDTAAYVSRELLVGSLRDLGAVVVADGSEGRSIRPGADACDDVPCAAEAARASGADRVVFGSLSRLGGKLIVRLNVLRPGEAEPHYRDQLTAASEEDLDTVMRRFAEGIAGGRPNSDRATVESVTQAEAKPLAMRATRSGMGVRAGFLFPTGGSFGGATRLTNLRGVFKYELPTFAIESTTLLGFTFGKGNFDWTLLDLGASRIFGTGDVATYLGASLGVHTVTVEQRTTIVNPPPYYYTYDYGVKQTETVPTLDLVAGVLGLRTYDFEIVAELRYHVVFDPFNDVGGKGAQGIMLTFGTSK